MAPDQPKYCDYKTPEVASLAIYNKAIAADSMRMKRGLYLVKSEFEVWVMYQCGLAAVCFLGVEQNPDLLVQWLMQQRTYSITALFGHDVAGRQSALGLSDATKEKSVEAKIGLLDGPLGFDLSDLFCQVDFNPRRFRDEIDQLDFAPRPVREAWRQNPEVGLPDPTPETATESTSESELDLLPCLNEEQLAAVPLPECVVEDLILASRPTLFTSQNNVGKSALAVDFCCCVSLGLPWNGRATKRGATFYLAAEGADGIGKRHQAWKQHHGIAQTPDFHTIPAAVTLTDPTALARLIRTIKHYNRTGEPAALVVIDTLSICSGSGEADENSATDMAKFVGAAEAICAQTGAATLILHHNNRGETFRGSAVLPDNCYGHLTLTPTKGLIKLGVAKIKDFDHRQKFLLRAVTITLENRLDSRGKPVTSVVFVPTDASDAEGGGETDEGEVADTGVASKRSNPFVPPKSGSKTAKPRGELSEKEEATWQALLALNANAAAGVTTKEWGARAAMDGVSDSTFDRAKSKLQALGKVSCDAPGKLGARFTPNL